MSPEFPNYPAPKGPSRHAMSRGWLVAAVGLVVVTLIIGTGSIIAFFKYGDDIFMLDTYIDDVEILEVLEPACAEMTRTVEDMTVSGTPQEQAAVIEKQNDAVSEMLAKIRELPPATLAGDEPTIKWLLDWDALLQERSTYAAEVQRGREPELLIPVDSDGDLIIERMDEAGWWSDPECYVPEALLDPYPVEVDDA